MTAQTFQPGSILVEAGATLPAGVSLEPSALSRTWRSVANLNTAALAAEIAKVGWTFFYMAGVVKKHAFGFDGERRVRTAVARIIDEVRAEKCNCLEITGIATKSFLGLPYVCITAHARHIQDGCQFQPKPVAA
jgi:hypothetical protein